MHRMFASAAVVLAVGLGAPAMAQEKAAEGQDQQGTEVLVDQGAPEVTVTQPAPDVTVVDPEPKVQVDTPKPDVAVQQPEPEVEVDQAEPQVTIEEGGQPDVTIRETEQAETGGAMPQDQTAEQAPAAEEEGAAQQEQAAEQPAAPTPEDPPQEQAAEQPTGQEPAAEAEGEAAVTANEQWQEAVGKTVMSQNGEEVGEITEVISGPDGEPLLIVSRGGFLGLGQKEYALRPADVTMDAETVTVPMTSDQVAELPEYDAGAQEGAEQGEQQQ